MIKKMYELDVTAPNPWENERQYMTFDLNVFSVRNPQIGISSLCGIAVDEVAATS